MVGSLSSSWMRSSRPAPCDDRRQRIGERLHAEVGGGVRRVGAVEAIEKRGDLEQPRAVLDEVLVNDFPGSERRWCAVHRCPCALMRLCERPQDLDAAQHNPFVDLVGVEGDADRPQQHDRQAAAEVLAELVEPGENRRLFADPMRQLRRVDGQPEVGEQRDDAPPVALGEKPRQVRVGRCRARCRSRPPRRGAADGWSAARACARPSGRSRAAASCPSRTDRRPWRCAGDGAPADRRTTCSIAVMSRAASSAARSSMKSKNVWSLISAAFTASDSPPRQSRSDSVRQEARIVDDGERRREGAEVVLLAEGVDAVLDADRRIVLRQHRGREADQADAAVRHRRRVADHVEHRAAADRRHVGVPVERGIVDRLQDPAASAPDRSWPAHRRG